MERSQISRAIALGLALCGCLVSGCDNPFAPALHGSTASLWTDASTVGGLLQNFATAYELQDSLRYAELLDEDFQFRYFDTSLQRSDGWYRETDLRITARMFRSFQTVSVIWNSLASGIEEISTPDSLIDIRVGYQLHLDDLSPLIGFARFTVLKPAGERFRILFWEKSSKTHHPPCESMPTYEYQCENGHQFEEFQSIVADPIEKCPVCGAPAQRKISGGTGLIFKGSGFYLTDYGRKNSGGKPSHSNSSASSSSESESKSDSKSESKPESKSESKPPSKSDSGDKS